VQKLRPNVVILEVRLPPTFTVEGLRSALARRTTGSDGEPTGTATTRGILHPGATTP
jgi:hypothetical protein